MTPNLASDFSPQGSRSEAIAIGSQGRSGHNLYQLFFQVMAEREIGAGVLVHVGCGRGNLWAVVAATFGQRSNTTFNATLV
jgi:hypothetical protein